MHVQVLKNRPDFGRPFQLHGENHGSQCSFQMHCIIIIFPLKSVLQKNVLHNVWSVMHHPQIASAFSQEHMSLVLISD